jgi:hypothetical protein
MARFKMGTKDEPCVCPVAGFCERYGRTMAGRLYDICRGQAEGLTPEKCRAYRRNWHRESKLRKLLEGGKDGRTDGPGSVPGAT